jgi:DsbC/DsbD-like thiol-disulfide interchange protein
MAASYCCIKTHTYLATTCVSCWCASRPAHGPSVETASVACSHASSPNQYRHHSRGLSLAASFHVTTIPQKQSPNAPSPQRVILSKKQSLRFPKPEEKKKKKETKTSYLAEQKNKNKTKQTEARNG